MSIEGRKRMGRHQWDHFIDGKVLPPASGQYLPSFDPRTGAQAAAVAAGASADVEAAVRAAAVAAANWRARRPIERGRILLAIAQKIREKSAHLSEIERLETGKPAWQAPAEIEMAAQYFEFYGGLVNLFQGEKIDLGASYHCYTSREPFGVVGVITPWNAPPQPGGSGRCTGACRGKCCRT
ncbi:aldehyde dehydrogenase family protein [Bradyrhizobium genosp. P]|uniref:aldehyde dehydrogenase family protein n=1 Tax=Bradyrhizobium genosp. P TaxID=83641 RepID=UPI003CF4E46F